MEIKKILSLQFIALVALILIFFSFAIYFSFSTSRKEEFYGRLASKSKLVAQMLIEIDEIDAGLLARIEQNNPVSLPNEKIIIFNYRNEEIYSNDSKKILKISPQLINRIRLEKEIRLIQKPYEIYGQFYTTQDERFVVFAGAEDIFGMKKLKRLRIILLIVFSVSLVIVFLLGRFFAARALQPVQRLIGQIDRIGIVNLNERLDEGNRKDELSRLAMTFNKMLQRLETAFRVQKEFIANASHELRTPLTVITGQIEVVLIRARSNEVYRSTLQSVLDDIDNINQLANKLLLLAQASAERAEISFSPLRIDDVLWSARKECLRSHPGHEIQIGFSEDIDAGEKLTINGNELLLRSAVTNLLDNACKYNPVKKVGVRIESRPGMLHIVFRDQGIGIPGEDLEMIFEPFFRSSNAKTLKGHGIGLSIVKKIVELHKGRITVRSEIGAGSEFVLQIPGQAILQS